MSTSKPMTLLCLETVLQNMDANTRFRIAQHCPAIQRIEKGVPLHIKSLVLSEYQFTVNDTSYRLGIYQDYPEELRAPDAVKRWNDEGGEQDDLDKYGIKTYPEPEELTPGDLFINNGHRSGGKPAYPPRIRRMESRLREYENELEHRKGPTPTSPRSPAYSYTPSPSSSRYRSPRSPQSPSWSDISASDRSPVRNTSSPEYSPCEAQTDVELCSRVTLQEKIKSKNAELLPFLMRRDGEEPTWRLFAQLTISKDESKAIYRGRYSTLAQNMKFIYSSYFGNRKHPIKIGTLFVKCYYSDLVLRFPENLKFKISGFKFEYKSRSICEALNPIICESSFPLQQVEVDHIGNHQWIRTARSLKINAQGLPTEYILSLECEKLKMRASYPTIYFSIADCIPVIEQWLRTGKAAGTCYEFAVQTADLEILKRLQIDSTESTRTGQRESR